MDELLAQFLIEAPELVQQGSDALLALERNPDDRALMDDAFRAIHTLKGSVGLFDLPPMAMTLHTAEDVLGAIRSGVRSADRPDIDSLLAVLVQTERWLAVLEGGGGLPSDAGEVARRLAGRLGQDEAEPATTLSSGAVPGWATVLRQGHPGSDAVTAIRYVPAEGSYFSGDDPLGLIGTVPELVHLRLGLREAEGGVYDPFTCRLVIEALSTAAVPEARAALRFVPDQVEIVALAAPASDREASSGEAGGGGARTLRVDAGQVEALAGMMDELVAAQTALAALSSRADKGAGQAEVSRELAVHSANLDRLVGRMHRQVTALRMTPLAPLLRRFPRVARELAGSLGREIDFIAQDNGVEADKTIIEGLFEPLTHLVRNAIDHGVEPPAAREAAGKARRGTIRLTAEAGGGRLELTLADDGAGIDPEAIRTAARSRGLISDEALAALGDAEAVNLIFLPGFSTARALTDVSGRGVGMDAVRAAVQRLGGRILIDSRPRRGTTVRITLPLSLTLTRIMVVMSEGEAYGLPLEEVLETLRVPAEAVIPIRAGQAFNWRNRTVPLLTLAALVGGPGGPVTGDCTVLVVRSGGRIAGVAVDAIRERADLAVRPLDGLLAGMPGVSGTTLLADGQVLMILDPEALVG
nr:chemotaxis protein CheA [uncultured Brevundimonas sp.]